jgi:hypothetical protein
MLKGRPTVVDGIHIMRFPALGLKATILEDQPNQLATIPLS